MKWIPIASLILVFAVTGQYGCAVRKAVQHREELGTLLAFSKDQEAQKKYLENETKNFEKVQQALEEGKIKPGLMEEEVLKKAGEPVLRETLEDGRKWSYKPGTESWFGGRLIRLYFNQKQTLVSWECVHLQCRGAGPVQLQSGLKEVSNAVQRA